MGRKGRTTFVRLSLFSFERSQDSFFIIIAFTFLQFSCTFGNCWILARSFQEHYADPTLHQEGAEACSLSTIDLAECLHAILVREKVLRGSELYHKYRPHYFSVISLNQPGKFLAFEPVYEHDESDQQHEYACFHITCSI